MADDITGASAHDFTFISIDGQTLALSSYAGKAVFLVNTASRCGFTKQYSQMQDLWQRYKDRGLIVLGIPSNDFGNQEPGSEDEIKTFCKINFDINFPMTSKVRVTGSDAHPFYRWAYKQGGTLSKPRWNFHKYLIDRNGKFVDWFASPTSPLSSKVINAIEDVLGSKSE